MIKRQPNLSDDHSSLLVIGYHHPLPSSFQSLLFSLFLLLSLCPSITTIVFIYICLYIDIYIYISSSFFLSYSFLILFPFLDSWWWSWWLAWNCFSDADDGAVPLVLCHMLQRDCNHPPLLALSPTFRPTLYDPSGLTNTWLCNYLSSQQFIITISLSIHSQLFL